MDYLTIKDKTFKPFLTQEEIQNRIKELAQMLNQDYAGRQPLIIPVLNGAFIFAADLVRQLTVSPEIKFIRISTYGDTMSSSQAAQLLLALEIDVDGRDVLILEDIVDTGYTSHFFMNYLREQHPRSVKLCTLLFKPGNFTMGQEPDYIGFEIPTKFVVGYGLDYAQQGRELEAIYQLAE